DELLKGDVDSAAVWAVPEQRTSYEQLRSEQRGVRQFEFEFRRKSGEIGIGLLSSQEITLDNEACSLAFMLDITKRKEAEKAQQQAEQTFEKLFYASPVGATLVHSSDRGRVAVNDSFLAMFGYTRESLRQDQPPPTQLWADAAAYESFQEMLLADIPI